MTTAQIQKIRTDHATNLIGWIGDNNMFIDLLKYDIRYDDADELIYIKPITANQHDFNYVEPITKKKFLRGEIIPYDTIQNAVIKLTKEEWSTF